MRRIYKHVYCECGCNRIASEHHGPRTQEHSDWCQYLLNLGVLTVKHYACVRLEKKPVDNILEMPVAMS